MTPPQKHRPEIQVAAQFLTAGSGGIARRRKVGRGASLGATQ
jgi:hypothetical protein